MATLRPAQVPCANPCGRRYHSSLVALRRCAKHFANEEAPASGEPTPEGEPQPSSLHPVDYTKQPIERRLTVSFPSTCAVARMFLRARDGLRLLCSKKICSSELLSEFIRQGRLRLGVQQIRRAELEANHGDDATDAGHEEPELPPAPLADGPTQTGGLSRADSPATAACRTVRPEVGDSVDGASRSKLTKGTYPRNIPLFLPVHHSQATGISTLGSTSPASERSNQAGSLKLAYDRVLPSV